jgi:hypothetical protein
MEINKLLGKLTPAHPDLIPIIKTIREKYDIPEMEPGEETLAELLGGKAEIDYETMRADIEDELRQTPDLIPKETQNLINLLVLKENNYEGLKDLEEMTPQVRDSFIALLNLVSVFIEPFGYAIEKLYQSLSNNLFEYLISGNASELPEELFQNVFTQNIMGTPVIVAMCGQASDPKEVAKQLTAEYTRNFGKDRPKITSSNLDTADFLRMKMEGKSLGYLVDIYAENHPSEFPSDFRSREYKEAKEKQKEKMKKRLQRLEKSIDKILGQE